MRRVLHQQAAVRVPHLRDHPHHLRQHHVLDDGTQPFGGALRRMPHHRHPLHPGHRRFRLVIFILSLLCNNILGRNLVYQMKNNKQATLRIAQGNTMN